MTKVRSVSDFAMTTSMRQHLSLNAQHMTGQVEALNPVHLTPTYSLFSFGRWTVCQVPVVLAQDVCLSALDTIILVGRVFYHGL